MKILGLGLTEWPILLAFVMGVCGFVLFVKSMVKVASLASGDQADREKRKEHIRKAWIYGVIVALAVVFFLNLHICENCHNWFLGKSYASYYYSTLCSECARHMTLGMIS